MPATFVLLPAKLYVRGSGSLAGKVQKVFWGGHNDIVKLKKEGREVSSLRPFIYRLSLAPCSTLVPAS